MQFVEGTTALRVFRELREYLNPILITSKFKESGVITPQEFILAGDFLVYKCPTWQWHSGIKEKQKDFLPAEKQYLVTRNVPCLKRVGDLVYSTHEILREDDWLDTHPDSTVETNIPSEDAIVVEKSVGGDSGSDDFKLPDDLDDIPDMDSDSNSGLNVVDPAAASSNGILKTRRYDISITYDKYYQTPRVFLFGFDEHGQPLSHVEIFQDISQDHAKKTVTIEAHPHESLSLASIHPCKHGNVMKKLIDQMVENGKDELRVDQYLLLFLKFLSAVLPTMEYDYTSDGF